MNEPQVTQKKNKVVVIGAGIAGLATAYYLKKRGLDVEIVEKEQHAGGAVRTLLREERYLIELGPNAFLASADPINGLTRELSIDRQVVGSESVSRKRYIQRGGRLHDLPMGPGAFLLSKLISFKGKLRLFAEPWVRSRSGREETLADFVIRRGGREILEALVDPFVSGVWAGDARQMEVESVLPQLVEAERKYGSVIRGMGKLAGGAKKRGLFSFRWGMGTLTARIEEEFKNRLYLKTAVEGIDRQQNGRFKVRLEGKILPLEADAVVIATTAPAAAKLLMPLDHGIFEPLSSIPYAPLAVVHMAFNESDVPHSLDGFGVLIPRKEGIRLLGSIWSSSLFPARCPKGEVLLTNFIGGATDPGILDLSDDEITAEVTRGLEALLKITAKPRFTFLKRWGQSIPQYTIGHRNRINLIKSHMERLPGIFLAGSYFTGVSVSDTIANARSEVNKIVAYMK